MWPKEMWKTYEGFIRKAAGLGKSPLEPDPDYYDNRKTLHFPEDQVHKLDDQLAFNPSMGPMKEIYDQGDMAIIQGVGYPNSPRSHFRSMDIWHTAEPTKVGLEGWLGNAIKQMHPDGENVVAAINFGAGLPRALVAKGPRSPP